MKEFPGVNISDALMVSLTGATGDIKTVICGIEIVAED
jgi:hypothetical protein